MNTKTPIYAQALEAAMDHAVEIDDMDALTALEDMDRRTRRTAPYIGFPIAA